MYVKDYSHKFQISVGDVEFLLRLFENKLKEFKANAVKYLSEKNL
jgi:hypothetical protein